MREAEATADSVAPARTAKDGTTATLLGIVFPGAGHYYAGEPGRGALITAGALVLGSAGMAGFGDDADRCGENVLFGGSTAECGPSGMAVVALLAGLGVWTYGAIDAHLAARRENERHGLAALPRRLTPTVAPAGGGAVRVGVSFALGGGGGGAR